MNYYNEYDKNAAAWLRELVAMGAIPKGEVDERSIADVTAGDLKGYTQCHFFAGIAGWSLALERAGVPATRPLWTGSCPCQDFSAAGKQKGFSGHRDLWPEFFRLIRECQPDRIFGEQVEAAVGHGWLDRLSADLEAENYAVGSVVLGAHSAGADHQRQRLYWVADPGHAQVRRSAGCHETTGRRACGEASGRGDNGGLADSKCNGGRCEQQAGRTRGGRCGLAGSEPVGGMADVSGERCGETRERDGRSQERTSYSREHGRMGDTTIDRSQVREHVHGELQRFEPDERRATCGMGDTEGREDIGRGRDCLEGTEGRRTGGDHAADSSGDNGGVVFPGVTGPQGHAGHVNDGCEPGRLDSLAGGHAAATGAHGRNFWSNAVAIPCRDNCFRRAEPGIFPLVARLPRGMVPSSRQGFPIDANQTSEARVMRLKGYGNAINVETARLFIKACEDIIK